jgi:hypothetical protein
MTTHKEALEDADARKWWVLRDLSPAPAHVTARYTCKTFTPTIPNPEDVAERLQVLTGGTAGS